MKNKLIIYACATVLFIATSCHRKQPQTVTGNPPEKVGVPLSDLTMNIDGGKSIPFGKLKHMNLYNSDAFTVVLDEPHRNAEVVDGNYVVLDNSVSKFVHVGKDTCGTYVSGDSLEFTVNFKGECSSCNFTYRLSSDGLFHLKQISGGKATPYGQHNYLLSPEAKSTHLKVGYLYNASPKSNLTVLPGQKVGENTTPTVDVSNTSTYQQNTDGYQQDPTNQTSQTVGNQSFALDASSVVPSANSISVTIPSYPSATAYRLVVYDGVSNTVVYSSKDILPSEITNPRTVSNSKIVSKGTYSVVVYAMNGSQTLKMTNKFSVTLP